MLFKYLLFIIGLMAVDALPLKRQQATKLGGVNLAGCEFGMTTEGGSGSYYCPGTDQITHFTSKGANLFRLPFGWQYMVGNNQASTSLDPTFLAKYDTLVQGVLKSGGYAMLDLHNYARWNGGIVGQGGPSNENLASVWSLLAKKYANEHKVIFGIMNEPHDLDAAKWATTAQAAVNAIRAAGAKTQMIALPGTFWQHPEAYTDGRNDPILKVTDPAASDNSLLILDIHQYLDGDSSGQSRECTTNGVAKLTAVTNLFKTTGRKAFLSETGGGNTASCQKALGEELKYVKDNSDTWLGFAVWSAGSFDSSYELSITPQGGVDNDLFKLAVQPNLPGSSGAKPVTTSSSASKASSVASSTRASSSAVTTSSVRPATSSARPAPSAITSSSVRSSVVASSTARPSSAAATSSKAVTPSSSRLASSASVRATSSSTSRPASSVAQPSARPTTSTTAPSTAGNFQTYKGAAGGLVAPAVTKSGNQYVTGGNNFNSLSDALQRSCYTQMNDCQNAANKGGNKGSLTVQACSDQQLPACLAVARAA